MNPASVGGVIAALDLSARPDTQRFDSTKFMGELASAYDETRPTTGQLPLFDVYRSMVIRIQSSRFWRDAIVHAFVGLSADQFRARLSFSCGRGTTSLDGRTLRLLPPLNPKDGLFLYQPAEARFGFVGRIEFVENEGGALLTTVGRAFDGTSAQGAAPPALARALIRVSRGEQPSPRVSDISMSAMKGGSRPRRSCWQKSPRTVTPIRSSYAGHTVLVRATSYRWSRIGPANMGG